MPLGFKSPGPVWLIKIKKRISKTVELKFGGGEFKCAKKADKIRE